MARTCKYEFPVFARFQLCNACRAGIRSPRWNDVETSTNTRTVEQGLYRRMDRSGFAVEPRINRRCGKADTRCFAYDHPRRVSPTSSARPLNLPEENQRGNRRPETITSPPSSPFLARRTFPTGEKMYSRRSVVYLYLHITKNESFAIYVSYIAKCHVYLRNSERFDNGVRKSNVVINLIVNVVEISQI